MKRINLTVLIGFAALGLNAVAQQAPAPQPTAPVAREAMAARRQAMQKLTADFSAAVKNGSLGADDQQKAQMALTNLGPHIKGAPRDPKAHHEAMKVVKQLSTNPALRPEDRDLLARDLAAVQATHPQKN